MTDEFSRFIKGKVIPNKEAETTVNAMMQKWVVGLCGFPRDGIHADQGSEFDNQDFKALCNRQGIKLTISPALAKWCNGGNECRHASVDITIKKLLEDNPKMKTEEAVDQACYARNLEIGTLGYSPQQIMFGQGSAIPGIIEGDIATDENITDSEAVRKHFKQMEEAREAFRIADSSKRIKHILKSNIPKYNDEFFEPGEKVYFQDEKGKWCGPAEVRDQKGRTITLLWGGKNKETELRRHQSMVQRYYEIDPNSENCVTDDEFETVTIEETTDDNENETSNDQKQSESVSGDEELEPETNKKAANTIRPLRRNRIQFKTFSDPRLRKGFVKRVGKQNGKDKHTCWIMEDDEVEKKINFADEVENWEYLPTVTFLTSDQDKLSLIHI